MATFKDQNGREWTLEINVPVMKRVKALTGVHLGELLKNDCALMKEITDDPITFANVLTAMVSEQTKSAGITGEQFEMLLVDNVAEDAVEAFWEAFISFCPSRIRGTLRSLATKAKEVQTVAVEVMTPKLAEFMNTDPRVILETILSGTASPSPESSASTPES